MKESKLISTVIAGKLKHKKIYLPDKAGTRSTKNIIRAAIFNSLVGELYGALFVELFAGSGSMGIEAVSRGASRAVFVERDRDSFSCLKRNVTELGLDECKLFNADTFLIYDDVLSYVKSASTNSFFYFDPPFDIRDGMENIYINCIELIKRTDVEKVQKLFFEHISSFEAPETIGMFKRVKIRKFGKTTISEYVIA